MWKVRPHNELRPIPKPCGIGQCPARSERRKAWRKIRQALARGERAVMMGSKVSRDLVQGDAIWKMSDDRLRIRWRRAED